MDPLSAFSLACNILQIVETGTKLLKKAKDYHAEGDIAEQEELAKSLGTLIELNNELELGQSRPRQPQNGATSAAEAMLIMANNECLRVSRDFAEFLAEFRAGGLSVWRSVLKSLKSLASREKLAAFQSSVAESRSNLNLAFLILIQYDPPQSEPLCDEVGGSLTHRLLQRAHHKGTKRYAPSAQQCRGPDT